jgi:aspartate aminotransferase-like enzyme
VETDRWQLDFVFAVCDQALALPAGLALGVASERLLARAGKQAGRGQYFDLVELARAGRPEGEGAVLPQHAALAAQLARMEAGGGIEARWTRHHEMLNLVEQWVLLHPGFAFLAPEGRRSWTVSCLRVPGGTSSSQVVAAMGERGWQIGQGTGGLRDSTIRIGHMGDLPASALSALLDTLGEVALQDSPSIV